MTENPEHRSEIVLLYDAEDANPNGNPLSSDDEPRIDISTGQAVVTDVRLKRYIRDQLEDDGHSIYIRNPQRENEIAESRDELFEHLFDVSEAEELAEKYENPRDLFDDFLSSAVDVRLFGATLSFSEDMEDVFDGQKSTGYEDDVPIPQYTGPLQFSHGRTLNEVVDMNEAKQLSTVVTSGGDAGQGTFAIDNRLEYALVRFHGVLNENNARHTNLTKEDVEMLDSVLWRCIKNQTLTRSKMGHSPQLYLRVEFEEGFHDGALHHKVQLDESKSKSDKQMRNINDVTVDVSEFLQRIEDLQDRVNKIIVKSGDYVSYSFEKDTGSSDMLKSRLEEYAEVEEMDVYN